MIGVNIIQINFMEGLHQTFDLNMFFKKTINLALFHQGSPHCCPVIVTVNILRHIMLIKPSTCSSILHRITCTPITQIFRIYYQRDTGPVLISVKEENLLSYILHSMLL